MTNTPLVCIIDNSTDYGSVLKPLISRSFPAYFIGVFVGGQHFLDQLPGLSPLPSQILLDRHMPTFDGHQTLLVLKGYPANKKIPVIMMNAEA